MELGLSGRRALVSGGSQGIGRAVVETLLGDPTKASSELGWIPQIALREMIEEMVSTDLENATRIAFLRRSGFSVPSAERPERV